MNNLIRKFFVVSFASFSMIASAFADRVLIDDQSQTVSIKGNLSCYDPVLVKIETIRPDLYEDEILGLQTIADSVRAMLSYECPQISSIIITGFVRGLDELMYQGEITRNHNWLLEDVETNEINYHHSIEDQRAGNQTHSPKRYDDELMVRKIEVIGLTLGMTVQAVSDSVFKEFDIQPNYDSAKGLLTMSQGDCDVIDQVIDKKPSSEMRCLKAWFTDNRDAKLERLELIQVLKATSNQVNDLLQTKHGSPTESITYQKDNSRRDIWRAMTELNNESIIQEFDVAVATGSDGFIIANFALYGTNSDNFVQQEVADIDLRL